MGLRGSRTFAVRGGSRSPATYEQEVYNNNIDLGQIVDYPGGEYQSGVKGFYPRASEPPAEVYPQDDMNFEGEYGDLTIGNISTLPPTGAPKPDAVNLDLDGVDSSYPKDPEATNRARNARMGAAGIEAIGGVINASVKHANFVSENNMKIYQAQQQENFVRADAARAILREGNKATERKGQALISAIAQGQSASGDLAQTAMSNEDVFAAQQAMNIEINSMRAIYGLQSEQINMQTNNRLSRINRNASIAQSIIGGVSKAAVGYYGN